jgi:hypothetical protein
MPGKVAGLSGKFHEAWVELPPVRRRISEVDYRDRSMAVVTFDDGEQVLVQLTGAAGSDPTSGRALPSIYIDTDDARLAGMDLQELRKRARLIPTELCWRTHLQDAQLMEQAQAAAHAKALYYFDAVPDWLDLPPNLDPALRRETVLHLEVKRILEAVRRLRVPEVSADAEVVDADGQPLRDRWVQVEEELRLESVRLETRHGRLVPDVTCEAFGDDGQVRYLPLLVEVTVTNHIDVERLERIRTAGEATLEIDLSLAGGRVNQDELRRLVVDELATKRWLHHPEQTLQSSSLRDRLEKQVASERAERAARDELAAAVRQQVLATPIATIATEYLDAVTQMLDAVIHRPDDVRTAQVLIAHQADRLRLHGFPEAGDENLLETGGILSRVLSIMLGRPVGYRYENLMGVLNAIRQTRGVKRSMFSIYFIAARAYPPALSPEQQGWFDDWTAEVRNSISTGETTYLRDPTFDRLLSKLFPKMAAGLAKPFGKLKYSERLKFDQRLGTFVKVDLPQIRPAPFIKSKTALDALGRPLLDTKPGQVRLQGRDLERWKAENPESASAWFPQKPQPNE